MILAVENSRQNLLLELGAWQHLDKSRIGQIKRLHLWDACSDASITLEGLLTTRSSNLAFSVENDRLVQALQETIDHNLEPQTDQTQTPRMSLERAYGVHITKYVFPWTQSGPRDRNTASYVSALPPIELELSDGRKLSTSLLVCFFCFHWCFRDLEIMGLCFRSEQTASSPLSDEPQTWILYGGRIN